MSSKAGLPALFWEWFKISLFVVGGGYAIIVVADEVFGRKLRWLREGELLEHLPVISSVPGLIAGNSAIYVGLKTHGRVGALVALAVAIKPPAAPMPIPMPMNAWALPPGLLPAASIPLAMALCT